MCKGFWVFVGMKDGWGEKILKKNDDRHTRYIQKAYIWSMKAEKMSVILSSRCCGNEYYPS